MGRQGFRDAAKLPAVEHLTMREMRVGHGEVAEIEDLADPLEHGARRQGDDGRRVGPGCGAPHGEAMDAARKRGAGETAADPGGQTLDVVRGLLHQQ